MKVEGTPGGYAGVDWEDPEEFRHLCDRCATSISDLHRCFTT